MKGWGQNTSGHSCWKGARVKSRGHQGQWKRVFGCLFLCTSARIQRFGFPPRPVFVIRMFLHMKGSQPFGLVNEGSLFNFSQHFPLRSKSFGYFWIVHLWVFLGHLASLASGPNHESIHGPFDMFCWSRGCWRVVLLLASTVVYWWGTHLWIKLRLEQFNPKRIEILVSAKLNNLWSSNSSTCPRLSQFGPNQMNGKLWLWMKPN